MNYQRVKTDASESIPTTDSGLSIDPDSLDSYLKKFWPFNPLLTSGIIVLYLLLFSLGVIYLYGKIEHWAIGFLILIYLLQLIALSSSLWKCQVRKLQIKQIRSFIRSSGDERIDFAELSRSVSFLDKEQLRYLIDELQKKRVLVDPSKGDNWQL